MGLGFEGENGGILAFDWENGEILGFDCEKFENFGSFNWENLGGDFEKLS